MPGEISPTPDSILKQAIKAVPEPGYGGKLDEKTGNRYCQVIQVSGYATT